LMEQTPWERYGRASGNPACQQCMVHCGYEPTAVNHTFSSLGGLVATVKAMLFSRNADPAAAAQLEQEALRPHGPLVQLGIKVETRAAKKETVGAA